LFVAELAGFLPAADSGRTSAVQQDQFNKKRFGLAFPVPGLFRNCGPATRFFDPILRLGSPSNPVVGTSPAVSDRNPGFMTGFERPSGKRAPAKCRLSLPGQSVPNALHRPAQYPGLHLNKDTYALLVRRCILYVRSFHDPLAPPGSVPPCHTVHPPPTGVSTVSRLPYNSEPQDQAGR